jgi:hypothetical protein
LEKSKNWNKLTSGDAFTCYKEVESNQCSEEQILEKPKSILDV